MSERTGAPTPRMVTRVASTRLDEALVKPGDGDPTCLARFGPATGRGTGNGRALIKIEDISYMPQPHLGKHRQSAANPFDIEAALRQYKRE
jgi:hypothetical protein